MLVKKNFNLKAFNTFGLDVIGDSIVIIENADDLVTLFNEGLIEKTPLLILGGGSNILFKGDYNGLVLLNRLKGIDVEKETEDFIFLKVNGGENWTDLVDNTVANNWWGIENLSLIPGTVGAAPIQNIGAYGVELKDVMVSLTAFNLSSGEFEEFDNSFCEFGYRSSIFKTSLKGQFLITSVLFKLSKSAVPHLSYKPLKQAFHNHLANDVAINMISDEVKRIRRSKLPDPDDLGNAGSFFKNPVVSFSKVEILKKTYPEMPFYKVDENNCKLAAGWLIEKAGWKGKRTGDAGVHEKQALVLVNYGNATGQEIIALSKKIQESVLEKFGIKLSPEVTII